MYIEVADEDLDQLLVIIRRDFRSEGVSPQVSSTPRLMSSSPRVSDPRVNGLPNGNRVAAPRSTDHSLHHPAVVS
jgi:hypothetical protein